MKKSLVICLVLILFLSLVSAGWWGDLWGKMTGNVVAENSLVAYYPFDGNAQDSSGNGFDGSVSGASFSEGVVGSAAKFDGNDFINVRKDLFSNLQGYTVSVWVKSDLKPSGYSIFLSGITGGKHFWYLGHRGSDRWHYSWKNSTNNQESI